MASVTDAPADRSGRAERALRRGVPPGPRLTPLLQTVLWTLAPTWLMDRCAARLGESFTITFWPSRMQLVLVSSPDAVKTVFTAPPDVAPSAAGRSPIAGVMGPRSVITLTGPEHMRQRKLLLPPFHGERMREYEDVIVAATREDVASWPRGAPMRLQERTRAITLQVILRAVFGVEGTGMEKMKEAIGGLLAPMRMLEILRIALRPPSLERPSGPIGRALDALDELIYEELARHRAAPDLAQRADILSLLMQARDEQGEPMTDGELRDELVSLLLAGHETTATSVAWAVERLVRHPRALHTLTDEIEAGESEDYLLAVCNETLRVRPVVPIVARLLAQPFELAGYELPAGTRAVPSIWLTNRNPRVYPRPRDFAPERFLDGAPETFSWIPFGGGIRRCIGAAFAQLEMKLMLRTLLAELEPRLPDDLRGKLLRRGEPIRRRAITLVPLDGARVVWEDRTAR